MKTNKVLHKQIIGIVANQIRESKPTETKQTFDRLVKSGYSGAETKKYIGQCVTVELFNIMKHKVPFDEKR